MKIIVTSGATREHIDPVRYISNISTGSLGSLIAQYASEIGLETIYIHGTGAVLPPASELITQVRITSAADALDSILIHLEDNEVKAVVHPMAVSDFTPESPSEGKISSGSSEFVLNLVPTEKIVDRIKKVRPDVFLVSFKLETGISDEVLVSRADTHLKRTGSDIVIANTTDRTDTDNHRALFIGPEGVIREVTGKADIASSIITLIRDTVQ